MVNKNIVPFILKSVEKHPSDIALLTMTAFKISRPAVYRHLEKLIAEGLLLASGTKRGRVYYLARKGRYNFKLDHVSRQSESEIFDRLIKPEIRSLQASQREIIEYGFTEMVNNVIDHSSSKKMTIGFDLKGDRLTLVIKDYGIGIFKKLKKAFRFKNEREAILHLSKGKLTTKPDKHSGEGVFFTSRAFDEFYIESGGFKFVRFAGDDWMVDSSNIKEGTTVTLMLNKKNRTTLKSVFDRYTGDDDGLSFNKTQVLVELGLHAGESYISRSQAKRVLAGLEKFKTIFLDFRRVKTVGQGFVDEVFRVFQNSHRSLKIISKNANENVLFMIQRSGHT